MEPSKIDKRNLHGIFDSIRQVNSNFSKINQNQFEKLIIKSREFFEEHSREKYNQFSSEFANEENIPPDLVNQLIRAAVKFLSNSEFSVGSKLDPISYGSIVAASGKVLTGGIEFLRNPEVISLRQRILNSYRPEKTTKIALFTPCSKIKPYRHSRTHKAIDKTIERVIREKQLDKINIDILVVSEPIGIIPRTWDMYYPAMNYEMTLPTWMPLDKLNSQKIIGNNRSKTFQSLSKLSKKENSTLNTNIVIEALSEAIADFLDIFATHYDFFIGYVRGSHRMMLEIGSEKSCTAIKFIPTDSEIKEIISSHGKLHWAFQGLRGKPALLCLENEIRKILDNITN